jgi:PEP-CTERM motif
MKKTIIVTLAASALTYGAYAQGSLTQVQGMFSSDGVTTPGSGASDPNSATTYYTGNVTLEIFYASTANVTANQIAAINALDGTSGGGAAALALLNGDGFSLVSAGAGGTAGGLNFAVNDGGFTAADPNTIDLLAPAPTGTAGWIAMYAVGAGGAFDQYSGVLAFAQNTGGNPTTTPAGTASVIATDPAGLNLVLTTTAVPEPGTMALAGLGGLSLFLFRRKK